MIAKYNKLLKTFPRPGGEGAHTAIFTAGCLGARAGLDQETVVADLKKHIPAGSRRVGDQEIRQGVKAGFAVVAGGVLLPTPIAPRIAPDARDKWIAAGRGATEDDFRKRSTVPLDWPDDEGWRALTHLYDAEELLFIGDDARAGRLGETIRPLKDWVASIESIKRVVNPKIMVNPLSGKPAPKKTGIGETLRGDACVSAHRFVVAEFDNIPLADQLAFWMAVPHLPVAALIHSGKKSIHAWLRVECKDADEWKTEIEDLLFPGYLVPMGLDPACKNASRLSRMPGHQRLDTGMIQKCLYLAPAGKAVSSCSIQ